MVNYFNIIVNSGRSAHCNHGLARQSGRGAKVHASASLRRFAIFATVARPSEFSV